MVDDEFVKFVSNYNFDQKKYVKIKYFFEAYLTDIKLKKLCKIMKSINLHLVISIQFKILSL